MKFIKTHSSCTRVLPFTHITPIDIRFGSGCSSRSWHSKIKKFPNCDASSYVSAPARDSHSILFWFKYIQSTNSQTKPISWISILTLHVHLCFYLSNSLSPYSPRHPLRGFSHLNSLHVLTYEDTLIKCDLVLYEVWTPTLIPPYQGISELHKLQNQCAEGKQRTVSKEHKHT